MSRPGEPSATPCAPPARACRNLILTIIIVSIIIIIRSNAIIISISININTNINVIVVVLMLILIRSLRQGGLNAPLRETGERAAHLAAAHGQVVLLLLSLSRVLQLVLLLKGN